jgi:CRP-like cAMP-binding protein
LVGGIVQICKDYGNYRRATVVLLKDGGGFGEFDLFGNDRQSTSGQAMTDCLVASVRKGDLRLAMERHPGLAVEMFHEFSEKLRNSEQTMGMLLHRTVATRLAFLRPVLAERFEEHGSDGVAPTIPLTHNEVAEMVACTREAVSKALGELRSEGFVEIGQRKITITDRAGLKGTRRKDGHLVPGPPRIRGYGLHVGPPYGSSTARGAIPPAVIGAWTEFRAELR